MTDAKLSMAQVRSHCAPLRNGDIVAATCIAQRHTLGDVLQDGIDSCAHGLHHLERSCEVQSSMGRLILIAPRALMHAHLQLLGGVEDLLQARR